jgi:feruloyl esterase
MKVISLMDLLIKNLMDLLIKSLMNLLIKKELIMKVARLLTQSTRTLLLIGLVVGCNNSTSKVDVTVNLLKTSSNISASVCENIASAFNNHAILKVDNATLKTASEILPSYCQVKGVIKEKIGFEMRAPAVNWNGKFVVAGCGGFCGKLNGDKKGHSNSLNESLKLGFAAIITDSGHKAESWQTQWGLDDAESLGLYAGEWMPLAVENGIKIITNLFGAMPNKTYFSGCSNGGRLGHMAAQRYPDLFDGIAAGSGIFDLSGNAGIHGLWLLQATRDKELKPVIDFKNIPMLAKAVMQQCDALDGKIDQLIDDPKQCKPNLKPLQCEGSSNNVNCLSKTEVVAIEKLYQGATVNGEQLFEGIPPGSESLWPIWVTGNGKNWGWGEMAALGYLRLAYKINEDTPFPLHQLILADEIDNIHRLASQLNATNPDLSEFSKAGGKLFYYHGKSDPLILYQRAEQFSQQITAKLGNQTAQDTARFFMLPGYGHCWEVTGQVPDEFNPVSIIDNWVNKGVVPDFIDVYQKEKSGRVIRERRVCSYPQQAVLVGKDKDNADSYQCRKPTS